MSSEQRTPPPSPAGKRSAPESAADLGAEMFRSPPRSGQTFSPVPGAMGWLSPGMLMDSPLRFLLQSPGAVAQAELQAPMNQTPISATELFAPLSPVLNSPGSKPLKLRRKEAKKSLQSDFLDAELTGPMYSPMSTTSSIRLFSNGNSLGTPFGKGQLNFLRNEDFQSEDHLIGAADLCASKGFGDDLPLNEGSRLSAKSGSGPGLFQAAVAGADWPVKRPADGDLDSDEDPERNVIFTSPIPDHDNDPEADDTDSPDMSPSLPEKPTMCNCKKSRCLKLYCECFAHMQFCQSCNCSDCYNKPETKEIRNEAIKSTKERNASAFKAKIHKTGAEKFHSNGCNCKKSACLKKYCECFEAGVTCAANCKCHDCQNFEGSKELAERRAGKSSSRPRSRAKGSPYGIGELSSPPGALFDDYPSGRNSHEKARRTSTRSTRRSSRVTNKKRRAAASFTHPTYSFYGEDLPPIPKLAALNVYTFLDGPSLYSASLVSRLWHNLARDDDLWE